MFPGLVDEIMAASKGLVDTLGEADEPEDTPADEPEDTADPFVGLCTFELSDRERWRTWVTQNTDAYGRGVIEYAARWASLVEDKIAERRAAEDRYPDPHTLNAMARDLMGWASNKADTTGVTGFMHGAAVAALTECWVYGDAVKAWHDKQWGGDEGTEGVADPAPLVIGGDDGDD